MLLLPNSYKYIFFRVSNISLPIYEVTEQHFRWNFSAYVGKPT